MNPKDPRLNGWKYKSFNLNDIQHSKVISDLGFIKKHTQLKEKTIFMNLLTKEVERIENEQGDHNTIAV
tara:strand:+ start:302 stop:508 length:207 start_codon:yes stop_codon:yes gene_type:complete